MGAQVWLLLGGAAVAGLAVALDANAAKEAADQTWPAFVLVAGLLLVGSVAASDHLFSFAGHWLAERSGRTSTLFAGTCVMVLAVTAVLNLDTSVAFLTPIAVHTSRRRRTDATALLAACLLLSNAGSLLLPGSNLTNLIVLEPLHVSGSSYLAHMVLPWAVSAGVTIAVIVYRQRARLGTGPSTTSATGSTNLADPDPPDGRPTPAGRAPTERVVLGVGLLAVIACVVFVLALRAPALPVLGAGIAAAAWRLLRQQISVASLRQALGLATLLGLLGLAIGFGSVARGWNGPDSLLTHLDPMATAAVAAVSTVLINNLPAAALWAAHRPGHPLSLLIGLDVGPNMFLSGSLAWLLWIRSARRAGGEPPIRATILMGLAASALAVPAAVGGLYLMGSAR